MKATYGDNPYEYRQDLQEAEIIHKPMTVGEMIEDLSKYPKDFLVVSIGGDGGYGFIKSTRKAEASFTEPCMAVGDAALRQVVLVRERDPDGDLKLSRKMADGPSGFWKDAVYLNSYPHWDGKNGYEGD